MPDERIEEGAPNPRPLENQTDRPGKIEPEGEVTEVLARVQEAVADMKDGELRESLEAAIEVIDSARGTSDSAECDQLGTIADALEGALDELEKGKVANLLPVIEQAQLIVQSGSSGF